MCHNWSSEALLSSPSSVVLVEVVAWGGVKGRRLEGGLMTYGSSLVGAFRALGRRWRPEVFLQSRREPVSVWSLQAQGPTCG
jgi:hypothetical protein